MQTPSNIHAFPLSLASPIYHQIPSRSASTYAASENIIRLHPRPPTTHLLINAKAVATTIEGGREKPQ